MDVSLMKARIFQNGHVIIVPERECLNKISSNLRARKIKFSFQVFRNRWSIARKKARKHMKIWKNEARSRELTKEKTENRKKKSGEKDKKEKLKPGCGSAPRICAGLFELSAWLSVGNDAALRVLFHDRFSQRSQKLRCFFLRASSFFIEEL